MASIKDRVGSGKRVKFKHYYDGNLWYSCDDGFEFPVPVTDAGTAIFHSEDKAILFMRYVRQHMEFLENTRKEAKND